ncbi:MAG: DEAD/DEAH box helicase [Clostridia bacterium]|nr:DEAD/DEAH box helicase [Clostridia bacterium]
MNEKELIYEGIETAFIDYNNQSNTAFKPQFISNDYKEGRKVISSIEDELLKCDKFDISVAFITDGGIAPLLQTLKTLEERGIKGRILTTDYLEFSDPKALRKLAELSNIELKMYMTEEAGEGFHTNGYIFKNKDIYRIITGSSNMTQKALSVNREWNTKIVSTEYGEYVKEILSEFESLWNSKYSLNFEDFIETYELNYKIIKDQRKIASSKKIASLEEYKLQPNVMQVGFINNLNKLIEAGEKRALLISATGTGKTYASAFALRENNPRKALFLVHREQIAKQAIESYKKIFGNTKTFGLLSGNSKDFETDYLFSTMQMMSKEENLTKFKEDEFDIIVIDEAHRIGANSYQKIIQYFKPKLLLGMTASPERTDGYDVYKEFNHNIAYEIRLEQALEENFLCPFHYFGITDIVFEDETIDDNTNLRDFSKLTCDERVNYIIKQIEFFGHSGTTTNGLVFCSSKKEAQVLSEKFNEKGYFTIALTGEDSQEKREDAINRLTSKNVDDKIDYIFTVDIFNEGVDIPEINQVIMLRPTESPIVFVQQLGRGLRKATDKEYVVILDFIGNYKNNFMIPIALSGDRSYNKDNIRRFVLEGERIIPGSSTIHFDEIAKKRIFEAIDTADFTDIKLIKENYTNLKNKLGHIPSLLDFDKYGEMDVLRIFDNKSLGSYYKFLVKYEKEYKIRLSDEEEKIIEFISKKLANGKRIHELELLRIILNENDKLFNQLKKNLKETYNLGLNDYERKSIINVLTNNFASGSSKNTYKECVFIEEKENDYSVSNEFKRMLQNNDFRNILSELIEFGISRYNQYYSEKYQDTQFTIYQKYTYEDVCRLLNWKNNEVPLNIGGYKYDKDTKTFPVFINYDKNEEINDTIKYEDHFESSNKLIAISKSGRTTLSEDVQNFINAKERGIKVELFVRKNKDDKISKEFYYLGRMNATGNVKEFVMPNTNKTAVEIEWILETPVREDIYEYIINC